MAIVVEVREYARWADRESPSPLVTPGALARARDKLTLESVAQFADLLTLTVNRGERVHAKQGAPLPADQQTRVELDLPFPAAGRRLFTAFLMGVAPDAVALRVHLHLLPDPADDQPHFTGVGRLPRVEAVVAFDPRMPAARTTSIGPGGSSPNETWQLVALDADVSGLAASGEVLKYVNYPEWRKLVTDLFLNSD